MPHSRERPDWRGPGQLRAGAWPERLMRTVQLALHKGSLRKIRRREEVN